jgi:aryl-alcohol dehydrogenase-like predicted oxidoreductase
LREFDWKRNDSKTVAKKPPRAIAELMKAGYDRYVGFSEVATATIRHTRASRIISDLQNRYTRNYSRAI